MRPERERSPQYAVDKEEGRRTRERYFIRLNGP